MRAGHLGRGALVLAIAGLGCRGEAPRAGGAAAGSGATAPADEKLAWPAIDEPALVALQATERFELGAPVPLAITPDGAVLFRRSQPRDRAADLYQLDAAGNVTLLASAARLLVGTPRTSPGATPDGRAGSGSASAPAADPTTGSAPTANAGAGAGAGIETISVSDDGSRVLVPLAGRLFLIERQAGASRELAIGPHRDPQLSPDGKWVAFVRDGDLWVQAIGEPQPARIARHPADDAGARAYATPDAIARAFGRDRGFWWSPDSQAIAFERRDARAVDPLDVADPRHPQDPPAPARVPRAGKPLATVDLGIVSVHGGAPRWVSWELQRFPYLARVIWPARGPLTLIVVGREQTVAAVVTVDAQTGATRPVLVDKDPAWIHIAPDALTWLPDGSGFLWLTESTGAWSLEHHAADGTHVGSVVTADVGVRRVAGVSPDGKDVVFEGAADPREQHVWRVPLAGGAPVALTSGGGVHTALAGHGVVVTSSLQRAGGRVATVLGAGGSRTLLPSVAERPAAPPTTQIEDVLADDHMQYVAVTRPHAFDPKVRYPVILRLGASLDEKTVLDALDTYLLDQWYADAGFIVVRSDGRGTPGRDRLWQRAIAGDPLTIPMKDQIEALRRLRGPHPELDLGRVGALGAELGGYLATLGALIHPEVFAAAVAVSPITDWALVDAASSERLMKTPELNLERYRRVDASTYAGRLTRPLLLMPRVPGSRVPPAHTFALIDALSAAGKPVEIAILPDQADAARRIAATRLVLDFFRRQLGPPVRPAVMPAARSAEDEEEDRERAERRGGDRRDEDGGGDRGGQGHR